jgi:hypothetical protein
VIRSLAAAHHEIRRAAYDRGRTRRIDHHGQLRRGDGVVTGPGTLQRRHYGVVGLTESAAIELGEYGTRINSIHPWGVATPMGEDPYTATMLALHPNYIVSFGSALPNIVLADPDDISDAVVWLASELSRTVTQVLRAATTDLGQGDRINRGVSAIPARRPEVAKAFGVLQAKLRTSATLPPRLIELIRLRIATNHLAIDDSIYDDLPDGLKVSSGGPFAPWNSDSVVASG